MKRALIAGAVVSILITQLTATPSQNPPDLSGTWKVDRPAGSPGTPPPPPPPPPPPSGGGVPPPPPPPPQTVEMTIVQTPTELRIDRTMALADQTGVYKFVYRLDGGQTTNQMGPIASRSTASWEGSKLVISSILSIDGKALGDSKEVYSLDGGNLIVEFTRTTPARTMAGKTIFVRSMETPKPNAAGSVLYFTRP